ncbi:membrane-spanning 4-domains subfamily A member 5-like [Sminthopsis crassicaudata]|uniref:membrane-spanning 4-domains subfamily A member 5-like n=1 Tax=Sminthopsis crassicaudata TaxID=9301 RepID=UPI003D69A66F
MLKPNPRGESFKMHQESFHTGKLIIRAIPYKRQGFVPSLLRGEPKLLGVLQILIGLIIIAFGVFLFSSFKKLNLPESKVPILYTTRYPYWAGACFAITGFVTIIRSLSVQRKSRLKLFLAILSVLVSVSGIALILYSLSEDGYFQCASPLSEGICSIGKILLHGVLSLLLILTIVQLSIAATLIAFQCKGIRKNLEDESTVPSLM